MNEWDALTFGHKLSRILLIVLFAISISMMIIGFPLFICTLCMPEYDGNDVLRFGSIAFFGVLLYPVYSIWIRVEIKHWKLKYLFHGKAYREELSALMSHYVTDKKEAKALRQMYRKNFPIYGHLYDADAYNAWVTRGKENIDCALQIVASLETCCEKRTGFVAFIEKIDQGEILVKDEEGVGEYPASAYHISGFLNSGIFSDGLVYLFRRVSETCDFTLLDNGLSPKYSRHIAEARKKLDEVYSPILFTYKDEITALRQRLETLPSSQKDETNS